MASENLLGALALAVSAAGILLVGVSLTIQNRQARISQLQAYRTYQLELIKLAYEHPDLRSGVGELIDKDDATFRRQTYINLTFMYYLMLYTTGQIDDAILYHFLRRMFRSSHARAFWAETRHSWRLQATSRPKRRFQAIAQRAFEAETGQAGRSPPSLLAALTGTGCSGASADYIPLRTCCRNSCQSWALTDSTGPLASFESRMATSPEMNATSTHSPATPLRVLLRQGTCAGSGTADI